MIGGLGIIDDTEQVPPAALQPELALFWLGTPYCQPVSSRYGELQTGLVSAGQPAVDLAAERRLADFLIAQARYGRIRACQPTGVGGMAVALAKLCLRGECGARLDLPSAVRADWALFGEYPAQAWVAVHGDDVETFGRAAAEADVQAYCAGTSGGEALEVVSWTPLPLAVLRQAFVSQGADVRS
jgi:phosphoribosylformylglycinamidine synthase